jgi:hypothetical protein
VVIEPGTSSIERTPGRRWFHRLTTILLVIFCFELGFFLLVAPWWGTFWDNNMLATFIGSRFWSNSYFRGAVSGVGVVNLYVALSELFGLGKK